LQEEAIIVEERWGMNGTHYRRIGGGPWEKWPNLYWHGKAPFVKVYYFGECVDSSGDKSGG